MRPKVRSAFTTAQAKLNLFLLVGNREADGYHQLLTLFLRIDFGDEIAIRVGGSRRTFQCDGPALPDDGLGPVERNLAYRAALAYADRAGWPDGFHVRLRKVIPVGAGLGGGSADAAAVLRCLDSLSERPLGEEALIELGGTLGADVPFLASDQVAAVATGRGDVLIPAQRIALPARDVLLLIPDLAVATADAYRWLDSDRKAAQPRHLTIPTVPLWTWDAVEKLLESGYGNDFEPVVEVRHPAIREHRRWLEGIGARIVRMSGSGSTLFAILDRAVRVDAVTPGARLVATRTAERVVQVEARE